MARYIDADKFIERLKASPAFHNMGMDGYFLLDVVETLLKNFPTADVVPNSEVAKEFTCFVGDPHKVDHCPYFDEIEKAKTEVAREIFEEIEKIIDKCHSECYEYEDGDECDTAITYISYISYDIAELKKKYIGDKR